MLQVVAVVGVAEMDEAPGVLVQQRLVEERYYCSLKYPNPFVEL